MQLVKLRALSETIIGGRPNRANTDQSAEMMAVVLITQNFLTTALKPKLFQLVRVGRRMLYEAGDCSGHRRWYERTTTMEEMANGQFEESQVGNDR